MAAAPIDPARRALLLAGGLAWAGAARADDAAAWEALRRGGVVALMRHADAPGVGDPAGWRLDDCATQRNLSDRGRADARAAGVRLRAERIAFARVLGSPWCRCLRRRGSSTSAPCRSSRRSATPT